MNTVDSDTDSTDEVEKKRIEQVNYNKSQIDSNFEELSLILKITAEKLSFPFAYISILNQELEEIVAAYNLPKVNIRKEESFTYAILKKDDLIYEQNLLQGHVNNPLISCGTGCDVVFSLPLEIIGGYKVCSFNLLDRKQRELSDEEVGILKTMAGAAVYTINKDIINNIPPSFFDVENKLKQSTRFLAREKALHDVILESIGDGVVGVDSNGEVIFVNKQAELLTGFLREDFIGKQIFHVLVMQDSKGSEVEINKRPVRMAMYTRSVISESNYFYRKRDGNIFPVAIIATPVDVFGSVIGGVVVFRDITKEKEVDRMKSEFISLASHQLRTPLSAMKWFCEMLIDGDMGELTVEQKDVVNNIYQSNQRMIELVGALLNISRIESGRIIVEPTPTNINELINNVILELKDKLVAKQINLKIEIADSLPQIILDPKLIRHVYMNLLTNAIKYTKSQGNITLSLWVDNGNLISKVSDDGYGIPSSEHNKVFDKFFRANNIAKIETDGTGLGLYLTKAIIDSSDGKIWFESEEGKGTTFWFSLPLEGCKSKEGKVSLTG